MTVALKTDLYELSMLASYFHQGMHETNAVCEMFVRRLPLNRRFLIAAGLTQFLDAVESFRFTDAQIETLKEIPQLRRAMTYDFVEYLRGYRFRGTVHALPEGTAFFEGEPVVRIEGTLADAQIVETYLLSTVNFQTQIATKAARAVIAAGERPLLEFGSRRTHPDAAVDVARAAYIAGFDGTSNVEAFHRHRVPVRGTMAHMFIMAFSSEELAFRAYGDFAERSTYLVDTYDTMRGIERALNVLGDNISAIRIDSGDLAALSNSARAFLDERGRSDVKILLSSDLDEYEIKRLAVAGSFDAAGIGTRLVTSDDSPSLGGVYKLVQIGNRPVAKLSPSKVTYPGAHQVYRHEKDGEFRFDHLGLAKEMAYDFIGARPLLVEAMREGRVMLREDIHDMRARARKEIRALPTAVREIAPRTDRYEQIYEVRPTPQLVSALESVRARVSRDEQEAPHGDS